MVRAKLIVDLVGNKVAACSRFPHICALTFCVCQEFDFVRNRLCWRARLLEIAVAAGAICGAATDAVTAQETGAGSDPAPKLVSLSGDRFEEPEGYWQSDRARGSTAAADLFKEGSLFDTYIQENRHIGVEGVALGEGAFEQVPSVSQLSDVGPSDWAFQALKSLTERYGCVAGYPDGTFRGDRSVTRYEFAAALNACLESFRTAVFTGDDGPDGPSAEDLDTIEKLLTDFSAELAALEGRVDGLEVRLDEIEANQFSTTTKLSGIVFFNLTAAAAGNDVKVETVDPEGLFGRIELRQPGRDANGDPVVTTVGGSSAQTTFSNLAWLSFNTSFTGKDLLVVQLATGNGESPANVFASSGAFNTFGIPFTDQTAGIQGEGNTVVIREFFYTFPATDDLQVVFGPRVNWYRYFDANRYTFFLTGAGSFNSIGSTLTNTFDRGSGVVLQWTVSDKIALNAGFLGENTEFLPSDAGFNTSSNPATGLFNGTWSATAELSYQPSDKFAIRFLYNRSRISAFGGLIGGVTGEPLQNGLVDAGPELGLSPTNPDGGLDDSSSDTIGISFDWLLTDKFGIFGRYGFATVRLDRDPVDADTVNADVQSFQFGFGVSDVGKPGALTTLSLLIPFDIIAGEEFFVSGIGDGGTQFEAELAYFLPLTGNIAIVPAVYVIANPNNFSDNPTIVVGNFRTQFTF